MSVCEVANGPAEENDAEATLSARAKGEEETRKSTWSGNTANRRSINPKRNDEACEGNTCSPDYVTDDHGGSREYRVERHESGSDDTTGCGGYDRADDGEEPCGGDCLSGMRLAGEAGNVNSIPG